MENVYENAGETNKSTGLFGAVGDGAIIKNLSVSGSVSSEWQAGGIVGCIANGSNVTIRNCTNKANVTGKNFVGGIIGYRYTTEEGYVIIENCDNYGKIEITGGYYVTAGAGGIIGEGANEIIKCNNYGMVSGNKILAGITGGIRVNEGKVINCINSGTVDTADCDTNAGGIIGFASAGNTVVKNCINIGKIRGKGNKGGIVCRVASVNWSIAVEVLIENCENLGNVESVNNNGGGIIGVQDTIASKVYLNIKNSYNLGKIMGTQKGYILGRIYVSENTETKTEFENVYCEGTAIGTGTLTSGEVTQKTASEMKSQSFVDLLNSNIGTNTDWKRWKLGKDGYPTFEE